jgi:hypothetical protein
MQKKVTLIPLFILVSSRLFSLLFFIQIVDKKIPDFHEP